jgi:hypothetical protein
VPTGARRWGLVLKPTKRANTGSWSSQWFGPDRMTELIEAKTGRILTARVEAPHAGWP